MMPPLPKPIYHMSELDLFTLAALAMHVARDGDIGAFRAVLRSRLAGMTTLNAEQRVELLTWLDCAAREEEARASA